HRNVEQEIEQRTHELKKNEERYRNLCAASPIGIFEADANGQSVYTNARWHAISGLSPEESKGSGWVPIIHPEDRDAVVAKWFATAGKGLEYEGEARLLPSDGVVRWIHSRSVPL